MREKWSAVVTAKDESSRNFKLFFAQGVLSKLTL